MLKRIENDEATGVLAWHPDRLARNSVDGGKIIYLLDNEKLQSLKFPQFWFEPTPQGKFMLNIAFGQSKYYVDSLSENTKRGLRQKVRRGEFPSTAPTGYLNDVRNKTIIVDKNKAPVIQQAFALYAKGNSTLQDISNFLAQNKVRSSGNKPLHKDRVKFILTNPFYYGHFRYAGEIHEGKHEPLISKKLFDRVQEVVKKRSHPQRKEKIPKAFTGLLHCGECNMMITAEIQKGHTYYRCTKKSKVHKCLQPYIREENLDEQLSKIMQTISLRRDWSDWMMIKLDKEEKDTAQSSAVFVQEKREKSQVVNQKLQRLLDGYLDQVIERDTYLDKKSELMSNKKSLEEQIINLEQKQLSWLEPMQDWIKTVVTVGKIANSNDLFTKKFLLSQIAGSNLELKNKKARLWRAKPLLAALRAANKKFLNSSFQKSHILAPRTRQC